MSDHLGQEDGLVEFHVDGEHAGGEDDATPQLLECLSERSGLRYAHLIINGSFESLKATQLTVEDKLGSLPSKWCLRLVLKKLGGQACKQNIFPEARQAESRVCQAIRIY